MGMGTNKTRPPTAPAACLPSHATAGWLCMHRGCTEASHDAVCLNIGLVYGFSQGRAWGSPTHPMHPLAPPAPHTLHPLQLVSSSTCILHSAAAGACRSWGYYLGPIKLAHLTPIRHTITQPAICMPQSSQPASLLLLLFLLPPVCSTTPAMQPLDHQHHQ
jgi:hypothetical protein